MKKKKEANKRISKDSLSKWFDDDFWQEKRIIYIGENVYADTANKFIKQLAVLGNTAQPITIMMNCLGGDYNHGMAIYDAILAIRQSGIHITIEVFGSAMSMGSLILQAADVRLLSKNSVVMIHYGYTYSGFDHTITNEKWADFQKKEKPTMEKIYYDRIREKHPKVTLTSVQRALEFDTIFKGQSVVDEGLADGVIGEYEEK